MKLLEVKVQVDGEINSLLITPALQSAVNAYIKGSLFGQNKEVQLQVKPVRSSHRFPKPWLRRSEQENDRIKQLTMEIVNRGNTLTDASIELSPIFNLAPSTLRAMFVKFGLRNPNYPNSKSLK